MNSTIEASLGGHLTADELLEIHEASKTEGVPFDAMLAGLLRLGLASKDPSVESSTPTVPIPQ